MGQWGGGGGGEEEAIGNGGNVKEDVFISPCYHELLDQLLFVLLLLPVRSGIKDLVSQDANTDIT